MAYSYRSQSILHGASTPRALSMAGLFRSQHFGSLTRLMIFAALSYLAYMTLPGLFIDLSTVPTQTLAKPTSLAAGRLHNLPPHSPSVSRSWVNAFFALPMSIGRLASPSSSRVGAKGRELAARKRSPNHVLSELNGDINGT